MVPAALWAICSVGEASGVRGYVVSAHNTIEIARITVPACRRNMNARSHMCSATEGNDGSR